MTRMKELRKKKGFSQVRMQMLTGIDQSDYSKIETGKRNMSFEQCRRIALAQNKVKRPLTRSFFLLEARRAQQCRFGTHC